MENCEERGTPIANEGPDHPMGVVVVVVVGVGAERANNARRGIAMTSSLVMWPRIDRPSRLPLAYGLSGHPPKTKKTPSRAPFGIWHLTHEGC